LYRNPKLNRPQKARPAKACRGLRTWRASKEAHGTEEVRRVPAALTARAKQERRRNDKTRVKRRTATKKRRAAKQRTRDWIKEHRHWKLSRLMKALKAKLQGTWNYYGLIGNYRRMKSLYEEACRGLYKWLNRRSQRRSLTWRAANRLIERFQVPRPRIVEENGQRMPCQTDLSFCQRLLDYLRLGAQHLANARASCN